MSKDDRKAPDADITLADGSHKRLAELWQAGTLVLVFLRHLG